MTLETAVQPQHTEWYRLALLLTGDPGAAGTILVETLTAAAGQVTQLREESRRHAWLARQIISRAKKVSRDAGIPSDSLWGKVASLPEGERNALALFHCTELTVADVAEIMSAKPLAVSDALAAARMSLAPGQTLPADAKLRFHRPWGGDEPRIAKAAKAALEKPEQRQEVESQETLDRQWHDAIGLITMPSALALPALEVPRPAGFRNIIRQPVVLAMVIACVVVLGVTAFLMKRKMDEFPGREVIAELIDNVDEMNGSEMQQVPPSDCGKLGDWFILKGFDGFSVPPEFEHVKAVGCRVFQMDGHSIAQVALDDKQNALLFQFRAADFKVKLNSANWQVFQQDDWAVAARGEGENWWVVAFIGDAGDMEKLIRNRAKQL